MRCAVLFVLLTLLVPVNGYSMNKLEEKQVKFTRCLGMLIGFAYRHGWELTIGDGYRDSRVFGKHGEKQGYGSAKSVHKLRLAMDLNLWVDGKYIQKSTHPVWKDLHYYWEFIGGAKAIPGDANHFSFEYKGAR